MDRRQTLATVLVVATVILAGCAGFGSGDSGDGLSGGGDGGGDGGDGGDSGATPGDRSGATPNAADGPTDLSAVTLDRAIIRTGTLRVTVDDFDAARSRLTAETNRLGGYVGASTVDLHRADNRSWQTGAVTLRIPAESFGRLLSFASDLGVVQAERTSTKDVTDRLVELDARLTNLDQQRARLRAFYHNASSTEALLQIEERLSSVQGEIERLTAKRRSLEDRVSYATLTVEVREPAPEDPGAEQADDRRASLVGTLVASVTALVDVGYSGLVIAVGLFPWVLALGGIAVVGVGIRRRLNWARIMSVSPEGGQHAAESAPDDAPEEGYDDS